MTEDTLAPPAKTAITHTVAGFFYNFFGIRLTLYSYDYLFMHLKGTTRYKQLVPDHLVCRFCGNPIDLLGSWKCGCGHKRPGNYFGRCPQCMSHPEFIDCSSCGFTMRVR